MKTIYLVRHTKYANPRQILPGRLPVELSEEGIKQAEKLANFFANKKIAKIYSSPVLRCKQTSSIISQDKICVKYDVKLAETFSAYQGHWDQSWVHFYVYHNELGGETPHDVSHRVVKFWQETIKPEERNVIICSHGDPLYLLHRHLINLPVPDYEEIIDHPGNIYPSKGSVQPIVIDDGEIAVKPMIKVRNL